MKSSETQSKSQATDITGFTYGMRGETDRGAVLAGAALLDELLGELLASIFVDEPKRVAKMLEYPGSCSTFAARVDLLFCLGVVGQDVLKDLSSIRKMRNQFAHSHWRAALADREFAQVCDGFEVIRSMRQRGTTVALSPRGKFEFTVAVLASHITNEARCSEHAQAAPTLTPDRLLDPAARNPLGVLKYRPETADIQACGILSSC